MPLCPRLLQAIRTFLTAGEDLATVISALFEQITHMLKLTGNVMRDLSDDVPCNEGVEGFAIGGSSACINPAVCTTYWTSGPGAGWTIQSLLLI